MTASGARPNWASLTKREVAALGLEVIEARFAREGFETSVDRDRGRTRLTVRRPGAPAGYEVRAATLRPSPRAYAFLTKASFAPAHDLLAALVLLDEGSDPAAYLIPSTAWHDPSPLLVDRDFIGKASAPEWGISITGKSRPLLEPFSFAGQAAAL